MKGHAKLSTVFPGTSELLPDRVKDVFGADHLCFLVHEVVDFFDLIRHGWAAVQYTQPDSWRPLFKVPQYESRFAGS